MARATIHETVITFRCPPLVREAIRDAAGQTFTNASAYVRAAVMERLRTDGKDVPGGARKGGKTNKGRDRAL